MGDRLLAGKPPQYFTKTPRPTQPPTFSGTRNEYQLKRGEHCGQGVKAGWLIPLVDKRVGGR